VGLGGAQRVDGAERGFAGIGGFGGPCEALG
jgi:hypothetical protein